MAPRPEFRDYPGSIDYQRAADPEAGRFPKFSIEEFADLSDLPAEARPVLEAGFAEQIRGRYILIGGDINDLDDFAMTPMTRASPAVAG